MNYLVTGATVTKFLPSLPPFRENLLNAVFSTMTYGVGHGVDPSSGSLIQCVFTKVCEFLLDLINI